MRLDYNRTNFKQDSLNISKNKFKDVVIGLGEIGLPLYKLISKSHLVVGYDKIESKMDHKKIEHVRHLPARFMHVCIPFGNDFRNNVLNLIKKHEPKMIVIHSTISPGTTKTIQSKLPIPIIYSATRGIHKRMLYDMKRYVKFYAIEPNAPNAKWASSEYVKMMKKCGVKTKKMTTPMTLELAKIVVDTSYYGWLINYAQLSNIIAIEQKVDYDEMWSFADEIQKYLGNRPKMFPGFIGGHCVIPNLDLIQNPTLDMIKEINDIYLKKVKNAKSISKKYRH